MEGKYVFETYKYEGKIGLKVSKKILGFKRFLCDFWAEYDSITMGDGTPFDFDGKSKEFPNVYRFVFAGNNSKGKTYFCFYPECKSKTGFAIRELEKFNKYDKITIVNNVMFAEKDGKIGSFTPPSNGYAPAYKRAPVIYNLPMSTFKKYEEELYLLSEQVEPNSFIIRIHQIDAEKLRDEQFVELCKLTIADCYKARLNYALQNSTEEYAGLLNELKRVVKCLDDRIASLDKTDSTTEKVSADIENIINGYNTNV